MITKINIYEMKKYSSLHGLRLTGRTRQLAKRENKLWFCEKLLWTIMTNMDRSLITKMVEKECLVSREHNDVGEVQISEMFLKLLYTNIAIGLDMIMKINVARVYIWVRLAIYVVYVGKIQCLLLLPNVDNDMITKIYV